IQFGFGRASNSSIRPAVPSVVQPEAPPVEELPVALDVADGEAAGVPAEPVTPPPPIELVAARLDEEPTTLAPPCPSLPLEPHAPPLPPSSSADVRPMSALHPASAVATPAIVIVPRRGVPMVTRC